jgi:hypothetical protein
MEARIKQLETKVSTMEAEIKELKRLLYTHYHSFPHGRTDAPVCEDGEHQYTYLPKYR